MDDCFLDDDCDDETSETGSDEPTEFSPDEPSDLPTDNCYGREQCFSDYSDADNNESLDSTSVDDETYSGPDCIATDCVGEPCEEGDSDTRSGSTFILTCVNGVWEGENVYHDGYSSESDSSDTSDGLVLGGACDNEGETIDYEYRNDNKNDSNGKTCIIFFWICTNGVWDHFEQCFPPPEADDDSGSGSITGSDSGTIDLDDNTYNDQETGSGPVLFEPCDNEGEIIPISQYYTANFESSGSKDTDASIKIVKGQDIGQNKSIINSKGPRCSLIF